MITLPLYLETVLAYSSTPIQKIFHPGLEKYGVELLIKREDLNHSFVSGNKWWKLKYNLHEAKRLGKETILTFGGAYSNHIYATAAAAREMQLQSVGIIRGEENLPLNPTLTFAKEKGMTLSYISREQYRKKNELDFVALLERQYGAFYLVPEGGTNTLAVKGCSEFGEQLNQFNFDYICLPVGTGGTMAGLISGLHNGVVLGFSVLKGGDFLQQEIESLSEGTSQIPWSINHDYHFGGYAKTTETLVNFIRSFERENNILLEQVYTGKMMYGIFDLVQKGFFKRGSTILAIHTGGLQGRSF